VGREPAAGRLHSRVTAALLLALIVGAIQFLSLLFEDRPMPPTDPTAGAKTVGDLYNLQKAATADQAEKLAAAAAADQAAIDAKATTEQVNAAMKASLKRPFFVQDADGTIVIVMPDSSDLGFHVFSPDPADTPLDQAPVTPAPPAPEPAPAPPVTPEPVTPEPVTPTPPEPIPPPPV
jgi:hypothetical protein